VHEPEDSGDGRDPGGKDWVERREGPSPKLILAGFVVVVILVFVLQNGERTQIQFLFLDGDYPLWTLLVVGAALGFIVGWLVSAARARRRSNRRARDD
jgi:uncharacterized integral membrane protein